MSKDELARLEAELEDDNTPDTTIAPEKRAAIHAFLRMQLLEQFHTLKTSAKLNRSVGDSQAAEIQYNEAKKVLKMIAALDEESKA